MKFQKLRLVNFKSFVDPTELLIAPGLTGIVGPNGCGKSNLLEALRWVMGENRPSQMRGGGMEDVIFAGASARKAKSFAEVMLSIDNDSHLAPAMFNSHEQLEVVRRITRDLGSNYRVNGKDARARDIQMMFADAATGAQSPSLVRQGQISELINAKPKARRRVLEDAAGISGLYQRRHEAELKLNAAENNLAQVDVSLDQLSAQLRSLERQARTAARYRQFSEEIRVAEALRAVIVWVEAKTALDAVLTERQVAQKARAAAGDAVRVARDAYNVAADKLPKLREEASIAAAILQRAELALEAQDEEEKRALGRVRGLEKALAQIDKDRAREAQIAGDAEEALTGLAAERDTLEAAVVAEVALDDLLAAAHAARAALETVEADYDEKAGAVARLEARAHAVTRRMEAAAASTRKAKTAYDSAQNAYDDAYAQAGQDDGVAAAEGVLAEAENQLVVARAAAEAAEAARREAEAAQSEAQAALSVAKARLSGLATEEKGLRASLAETVKGTPVTSHIRVTPGYEKALGAALGDDLGYPLLEAGSSHTGWQDVAGDVGAVSWPAGVEALVQYVEAPHALARRLAHIGVTTGETVDAGQLLPGQRVVTKAGHLWRWDGFSRISGGGSAAAMRLEQQNRLETVTKEHATARGETDAAMAAFKEAGSVLQNAQRTEKDARAGLKEADSALTRAMRERDSAQAKSERLQNQILFLKTTLNAREEAWHQAEAEHKEAARDAIDSTAIDAAKQAAQEARMAVEAARVARLSKQAIYDEARAARTARQKRLDDVAREIAGWVKRRDNNAAHVKDLVARAEKTEVMLREARQTPDALRDKRRSLLRNVEEGQARTAAAKEALALAEAELGKLQSAVARAEDDQARTGEALARIEAGVEARQRECETARAVITSEFNQTPEDMAAKVLDGAQPPDLSEVDTRITRAKAQRDMLGAVNLRAEDDMHATQAEHGGLARDKAEIEEAIAKLRQGIGELKRESRSRLLAAFDEVNNNFKTLFGTLFGGGEAELRLVDHEDPLEAGLEILCQPPGKKLATLSLLSGGEQTLTALSLIFAVFLVTPSPICVLDEVDAPLDDANVARFCDLLRDMVGRTDTRFLIITHHAVTMARMDRLFGVTMREKGVSQLVSVDLSEAEAIVDDA